MAHASALPRPSRSSRDRQRDQSSPRSRSSRSSRPSDSDNEPFSPPAQSTSRSPSRSRRRGRAAKSSEDTIKARTSRQRPPVPAFEPITNVGESRDARGRGRSRESAQASSFGAVAAVAPRREEPETDYGSELEADMDDDLFFGDFCFTCGAPLSTVPSLPSPSASPSGSGFSDDVRHRGYCSEDCEQTGAPHFHNAHPVLARRPTAPYGLAGLTMSPMDSPAMPAFGRSEESECSTSPSSSEDAGSPSPFNALGGRQLRLTALDDEPTQLSLPPSIAMAHGAAVSTKSPPTSTRSHSTPTGRRKLNFDYSYAFGADEDEIEHQSPTATAASAPFVYSVPTPARSTREREGSVGFGVAVQSVDSVLRFKRKSFGQGMVSEKPVRPNSNQNHVRKASISSLLSLGPSVSAGATTTLSFAVGQPTSSAGSSPAGSPTFPSSLAFSLTTSPHLNAVVAPRLPASPTNKETVLA